ncbi:MAG: heme ABC transporter ATP-binding protein [Microbacteriaceae bacterium]|nr:heme ABC transporter ATP-binding protein [Microbacteriaceae bacterium]
MITLPERLEIGETAISARNVSVTISEKPILKDVDFELRAGEVAALVGPNGAGKSTLLSALTGDLAFTGEIDIAGKPLDTWKVTDLARVRAVQTQQNQLAFPFTAYDVVEMGRSPWQRSILEVEDESAISEAMEKSDTSRFTDRRYPSLSGGEKSRVSFARVLAQRTSIILLDEPTAALDIKHQESVLGIAREMADEGVAVVVVLHDLNLAAAYSDTVTLLSEGSVVAKGTPREVLKADIISNVYHYPVQVITNPETGEPIVLPIRK